MAKIDLDSLNIEQLAALRDDVTEKLLEKVAARQVELEAELEKLSQYGKAVRKSPAAAPAAKTSKAVEKKQERRREQRRDQGSGRRGCVTMAPEAAPFAAGKARWQSARPCYSRCGPPCGLSSRDRIGSSQRRGTARRHDRRGVHHRSLHRRRHFDRMRHSRFPLSGRIVDPQPPDPVR